MIRNRTTDLALIAVFAALIAAFALVPPIPLPMGVPITLQTLAVALTALVLGPWRGLLATLLYLVVGFAGLPVFAGGAAGLAVLSKPSIGYLLAFPSGALVAGAFAARVAPGARLAFLKLFGAAILGCGLLVHAAGVLALVFMFNLKFPEALAIDLPFIPGDLVKFAIAAGIALTVRKAFPALVSPAVR